MNDLVIISQAASELIEGIGSAIVIRKRLKPRTSPMEKLAV